MSKHVLMIIFLIESISDYYKTLNVGVHTVCMTNNNQVMAATQEIRQLICDPIPWS